MYVYTCIHLHTYTCKYTRTNIHKHIQWQPIISTNFTITPVHYKICQITTRSKIANLPRELPQAALRTEACLAANNWQLAESKESSYVGGCSLFVLMLSHAEMNQVCVHTYVAVCCSVLQCVAVCVGGFSLFVRILSGAEMHQACIRATHFSTLQHMAAHCNILQHIVTLYSAL